MTTVASVDYAAKRIYLSAATVGVPLDTVQVYRDVRALRVTTPLHRQYLPIIAAGGNIKKTATTFTQSYAQLASGCRIVPFNAPQSLVVVRETFSLDGQAGIGCFDRSSVTAEVDIDVQVLAVEIREVAAGGGSAASTAAQNASAVWAYLVEGGVSAEQMLRVLMAAVAGKSNGTGSATENYLSMDGSKPRVTATFDGAGNRSSVAVDGS